MTHTKTNWFAFLRSLEDITRNGKSQFTGAEAFNEFINLLFLKLKEPDIKKKLDNADDYIHNDIFLKSAEVDEDFLIENLYKKYCKLHRKNRDKKPDPEIAKKINEQACELYSILYDFDREWDETTVLDKKGEPTGERNKKLNGKKKCVLRRFLHQDDFYNIAEGESKHENISQFTIKHKMDIVNLIIKIHEIFGDKEISDVDFDAFGEGYEKYTADEVMSAKSWGQYFTRRDVIDIIVEEIKPQYNEKGSDETCGTGGFLIGFDKYVQSVEKENLDKNKIKKKEYISRITQFKNNVYGNELKWTVYKPLMLNLLCRKINLDNINFGSCFDTSNLDHREVCDFMAGNPPFGCSFNWEPCMNDKIDIKVKNSVALILQLYLYKLKEGGRCGLVIDRGILNNGSDKKNSWEKKLRTKLINDNNLYKVILLPTGIFAHTNFATAVVFFKKGGKTKQIEFVEGYFKDEDKGKGNKTLYFKDGIVIKRKKIKKKNYSLKLDDYIGKPKENIGAGWVKLGDVCEIIKGKNKTIHEMTGTKYRVIGGGFIPMKDVYSDEFNANNKEILMSNDGAYAGYINKFDEKMFITGHCNKIIAKTNYNINFIHYYLKIQFQNKLIIHENKGGYQTGQAQPSINKNKMLNKIQIPDIPRKHQEEIVEFLDKLYKTYKIEDTVKYLSDTNIFNLLINRQYTEFESLLWYQDQIPRMMADFAQIPRMKKDYIRGLFNTVETEKYKLEDIVNISKGSFNTKDTDNSGKYPYYNSGCKNPSGTHSEYTCDYDECILFVKDGGDKTNPLNENSGMCKPFYVNGKVAVNNCNLIFTNIPEKNLILKYLYFYLEYNRKDLMATVKYNSGLGHISIGTIKNHIIKIPSIADQKKIIEEIEKVESEQSSYAKYAEMLKKQIEQMNTTIKNICNIKQKEDDESDDSKSKKKSKKIIKVVKNKSNSESDESDDSKSKKKSKKVIKNKSDSDSE